MQKLEDPSTSSSSSELFRWLGVPAVAILHASFQLLRPGKHHHRLGELRSRHRTLHHSFLHWLLSQVHWTRVLRSLLQPSQGRSNHSPNQARYPRLLRALVLTRPTLSRYFLPQLARFPRLLDPRWPVCVLWLSLLTLHLYLWLWL